MYYIAYGETDEWAHKGNYKDYLDAAHTVDKWLGELWAYLQSHKKYKDNTLLIVTVDHGRGRGKEWTSHNNKIPGSDEIWFAVVGPGIRHAGEMANTPQLYQKQIAQTIARLMGYEFKCEYHVGEPFDAMLK